MKLYGVQKCAFFRWGREGGTLYIDRPAVSGSRVPTEAVVEQTAFVAYVKTAITD